MRMQQAGTRTKANYAADLAACRTLLSTGSRTFYAASFLLPRRIREPASALYAFCRLADDVIDLGDDSEAALASLYKRLDRAYAGEPEDTAADRAFAATVAQYSIPRALPEALLEGFAWDAAGREYEDLASVQAYGARVAGTVGAMMALLMGVRSENAIARATDLGIAMQLTNIARDVGEDARAGRLYLPRQWLRDVGIDPDQWLSNPVFTPELGSVIDRLLGVAETLYARAGSGIASLPADCRPGIYAAKYLYAEIGHQLKRDGLNSVSRRAFVPARKKLQLLGRALAATPLQRSGPVIPVLAEASFLVHAATEAMRRTASQHHRNSGNTPWWNLHGKAIQLIELMDQLKRRELEFGTSAPRSLVTASQGLE
jgi:15-cis-phytoene synthase